MNKEKYVFYMIGMDWFSADQGDSPNHGSFPSFHTFSASEAEKKFKEYEARNESWSFGSARAYMVGALPDGSFELLKGADPK